MDGQKLCRHEFPPDVSRHEQHGQFCGKCDAWFTWDELDGWDKATALAAADISARDAEIAGLHRKIRGLASMIPPLTPEEAQREWDSFDGPVEPMTEAEVGRIVDEVMNRVARSKGKVHVA